ncbi:MAG: hypothetical protein WGN25_10835 [Candidatus Electrothrix sp. GW3-4]|uniref:hypothetical protein n=1 Tax=Candidatus Electrothrix sp. GW3-4 TaxID=3126740 RepID=UPI0030D1F124
MPKLLKEAHQVKEALEKIGDGLPDAISADVMATKINALEAKVREIDSVNADKTRLVNEKGELAEDLSDYIVRSRSTVKGVFGADSTEYDMVGGTRASERKKGKRKEDEEA